jgi:hypothetical protein
LAATAGLTSATSRAADAWLSLLTSTQREKAQLAWDNAWREDWHYTPRRRPGLTLNEMTGPQTDALWSLLGSFLSPRGVKQTRGTIELERILGEISGSLRFRDPGNYALVLFGDPKGADPWACRFEGHHLSLTAVVIPDVGIAATPVFFGANPATVREPHDHAGFRLLGAEEDEAFGLIRSLEGDVRAQAIIAERSLGNIVAGPGREASLRRYEGVSLERLSGTQRGAVMRLLELYTGTLHPEIAHDLIAKAQHSGAGQLHFAWAGSLEKGQPHYFRIHGPSVLLEYDNTQGGGNHVHSVLLDPVNVFGRDLLKAHYQTLHLT